MSDLVQLEFASRIADGRITPADLSHLQRGFATWIHADGAVSLERCLRLPNSRPALQRAQRDLWLRELARLMGASGLWLGPVAIEQQLNRFIERGPWRFWKKLQDPPPDSTSLDAATFRVLKCTGGRALSARHLSRVVGDICAR